MLGSTFVTTPRQAVCASSTGIAFFTDGGVASGGTNVCDFFTGGYNSTNPGIHITGGNPGRVSVGGIPATLGVPLTIVADASANTIRSWRNANIVGWGSYGLQMAMNNAAGTIIDYATVNMAIVANGVGIESGSMTLYVRNAG